MQTQDKIIPQIPKDVNIEVRNSTFHLPEVPNFHWEYRGRGWNPGSYKLFVSFDPETMSKPIFASGRIPSGLPQYSYFELVPDFPYHVQPEAPAGYEWVYKGMNYSDSSEPKVSYRVAPHGGEVTRIIGLKIPTWITDFCELASWHCFVAEPSRKITVSSIQITEGNAEVLKAFLDNSNRETFVLEQESDSPKVGDIRFKGGTLQEILERVPKVVVRRRGDGIHHTIQPPASLIQLSQRDLSPLDKHERLLLTETLEGETIYISLNKDGEFYQYLAWATEFAIWDGNSWREFGDTFDYQVIR